MAVAALPNHADAQNAAGFRLKNRSVFVTAGAEHDPFWPIGWHKPNASEPSSSTSAPVRNVVEFRTDGIVVTSILLGNPPLAVINGKGYAEGELMAQEFAGQTITVQIAAIQDGAVVLRYQDKNYTVLLRRKGEDVKTLAKSE